MRRNELAFPTFRKVGECSMSQGGVTIGELLTAIVVAGMDHLHGQNTDQIDRTVESARAIVDKILSDEEDADQPVPVDEEGLLERLAQRPVDEEGGG